MNKDNNNLCRSKDIDWVNSIERKQTKERKSIFVKDILPSMESSEMRKDSNKSIDSDDQSSLVYQPPRKRFVNDKSSSTKSVHCRILLVSQRQKFYTYEIVKNNHFHCFYLEIMPKKFFRISNVNIWQHQLKFLIVNVHSVRQLNMLKKIIVSMLLFSHHHINLKISFLFIFYINNTKVQIFSIC